MEPAKFYRIYWREPVDSKELHQPYHIIGMTGFNKTKDWALVQTAALVINKGVEVRLTLGR